MATQVYYFKFKNREECYSVCRAVGYCHTDSVTGDTFMDVPGDGHINVVGLLYDPDVQPMIAGPEGTMEPDPENIVWKDGFHLNVVIKDGASIPDDLLQYQIEVNTPSLNSR